MPNLIRHDGVKMFAFEQELKQGDIINIQVLKYANRTHPFYWKILIDEKYFTNMLKNFKNNVKKDEIPVNMEHDRTRAQAWFKELYTKEDELRATVELTKDGADNLNGKHYKYFSAEIADKYQDPDTNKRFENVLVGGAFTNYPYFNGMDKIVASAPSETTNPNTILSVKSESMLKDLLKKFSDKKSLNFSEKLELTKAFSEATPEEQEEVKVEVEATLEKHEDTGTVELEKKVEDLEKEKADLEKAKEDLTKENEEIKQEKVYSETIAKFNGIHIFNQPEAEKKEEVQKVIKAFSKLAIDELEAVQKLFSDYQKTLDVLTDGQLSKSFSKGEEKKDEKMSKDGKKKVISESAFNKLCNKYAKDKDVNFNKAYETLKDGYEIEK